MFIQILCIYYVICIINVYIDIMYSTYTYIVHDVIMCIYVYVL